MRANKPPKHSVTTGWQALRQPVVCSSCGVSSSQLWRLIRQGKFPEPVKISERCNAWDSRQIDAWLAEKFGGEE